MDASGLPLARVTVTATSPTQIGGRRVAQTDEAGQYHLLGLTPGNFTLRFSAQGLVEVVHEVYVGVNDPVVVDVAMEPVATTETQVIRPQRPIVEARKPSVGQNYDAEFLKNVPLRARNYQSVMALTPGTAVTLSGGTLFPNPNVRGGTFLGNTYTVDGFDTTDFVSHTFGTNFNFDAISELQVRTAGLGAEHSMTSGGVANIVTKSGSNEFHIDTSIYYVDENLVRKGPGEANSKFMSVIPNLNVSGPIVRDTLWYFASVQYTRDERTLPGDPAGVLPLHPTRVESTINYLAKLTWAPNSRHKITFMTQGAPGTIDNILQQPSVLKEAEVRQEQNVQIYSLAWEAPVRDDLFVKLMGGFQQIAIDVFPQSCMWNPGGCLTTPTTFDAATGVQSGNGAFIYRDTRNMLRLNGEASWFPGDLAGSHELKLGSKFTYATNPVRQDVPGGIAFTNMNGMPAQRSLFCRDYNSGAMVDYDPANPAGSACQLGAVPVSSHGYFWNTYLQDTWSPTRFLHITPGVALNYAETFADPGNGMDAASVTRILTWTPHFYVAWDPTHDGKTKVQAAFNQYVDSGYLYIAQYLSRSQTIRTCDVDPMTGQYNQNCFNQGGPSGRTVGRPNGVDMNGVPRDPKVDLDAPRITELLFGVDREVLEHLWLGGEFVYRRFSNQWEDIETNAVWDAKGAQPISFKNGNTGQFVSDLETPNEAYRRYYGFTLNARRNFGAARILASWTISKTEGTYADTLLNGTSGWPYFFNSPFLDNPTQNHLYFGPLPEDHTHVIRALVSYDATNELRVGAGLVYQTGAPYSRYFLNPFTQQFSDLRSPRGTAAEDPNDTSTITERRLPSLMQIDLHLSYSLQKLLRQNLIVMVDIFNLLNERTPLAVEENNITQGSVRFGSPTAFQQPFQVRLGLRYMY